ncbi:hypothetical protein GCM10009673_12770 [Nesterenkonia sandarakina]
MYSRTGAELHHTRGLDGSADVDHYRARVLRLRCSQRGPSVPGRIRCLRQPSALTRVSDPCALRLPGPAGLRGILRCAEAGLALPWLWWIRHS